MPATHAEHKPTAPSAPQARACPACAYSLAGLPDSGNCPECGSTYDTTDDGTTTTRKAALAPRCHHCLYNLTGLPNTGPCPECGRPYDTADGPPPSLAEQAADLPERLSIGVRDAQPWFWERILPSARSAAVIMLVLGTATLLIWIAWESIRALINKFTITDHGHRPAATPSMPLAIGRTVADTAVHVFQALPFALVFAALLIAHAGIQHRRVRLSPTLALTDGEAQSLGRFALYTGFVLAAILYWASLGT